METSKKEISSPDHLKHKFEKRVFERSQHNQTIRCGNCKRLFDGLVASGIECDDCKEIYHTSCFSKGKPFFNTDAEAVSTYSYADPMYNHMIRESDLEIADFDLTYHTNEEIKEKMDPSVPGTFALATSDEGYLLVKKEEDRSLKSFPITTVRGCSYIT